MNHSIQQQLEKSVRLLTLEQDVRRAKHLTELSFIMVNSSQSVLGDATIICWTLTDKQQVRIERASNISSIDPSNTPFLVWLKRHISHLNASDKARQVDSIPPAYWQQQDPANRPEPWHDWLDWSSLAALWCPLSGINGQPFGGLLILRQQPWQAADKKMAARLSEMYGYAMQALTPKASPYRALPARISGKKAPWLLIVGLIAVLHIPVQQSVLAPASVVAKHSYVVTAPIDGVIEDVLVSANEFVAENQIIVEMDKTRLQNRVDVAEQMLKVARSKYTTTQQLSFADPAKKALLTPLRLQVEQQQAEVNYARQLLRRATVRASRNGIAIFRDANELLGKPVKLGEKVMTLANPENIEVEINLPADDAIVMHPGAGVELFLNIDPAHVLHGELIHASYRAEVTPEGVLAYRLLASLGDSQPIPRIGLKGTAKLIGKQVRLYEYLFRRPLTMLRQTLGW